MSETNPPPVAPVVTDEMVAAAENAYDSSAAHHDMPYSYSVPMRAAITAALQASGELERLRTALTKIEQMIPPFHSIPKTTNADGMVIAHGSGIYDSGMLEGISLCKRIARTALQGDAP